MSDEHVRDSLQSLFSDDSFQEGEVALSLRQVREADLSISGLFSSDEGDDQRPGSAATVQGGSAAILSSAPGKFTNDGLVLEMGSPGGCSTAATAAAREQMTCPVASDPQASVDEASGNDLEIGHGAIQIPATYERPVSLSPGEASGNVDLAERREPILNAVLTVATIGGGALVSLRLVDHQQHPGGLLSVVLLLAGYLLLSAASRLRQLPSTWRIVVLIGVFYAAALHALSTQGVTGEGGWYLLVIPVLCFTLVGERPGLTSAIANVCIYAAFAGAHRIGWLVSRAVAEGQDSLAGAVIPDIAFMLTLAAIVIVHAYRGRASVKQAQKVSQAGSEVETEARLGADRRVTGC